MTNKSKAELEDFIAEVMSGANARGMAIAVFKRDGSILYEKYLGYRDAEKSLEINKDTVFGLASVTKSFTALSIMQMEEDGLLNVLDAVKDYVPEFSNKNRKDTVRISHLLTHSGGFFPLSRITVDKVAKEMGIEDSLDNELCYRDDFADEGIKRVASRLDSQTKFTGRAGERLSYCNDGYGLLSDIIRRHSGYSSYANYVEKRILEPLGMTRSNIGFLRNTLDDNSAVLYSYESGEWRADKDFENNAFVLPGGGAMKSSLSDMIKYVCMYLNDGLSLDGKRIISRYSLSAMFKPREIMKPGVYYGYGLESHMIEDIRIIDHSGSLPGVSSCIMFSPQAECGVVVLCNTMDVPSYAVANAAIRASLGYPIREERIEHKEKLWSEEELKELEGSYISGEGDAFSLIRKDNDLEMCFNGEKVDLKAAYPFQGIVRKRYEDRYLTAIRDEEGHVFASQYGSRIFMKEDN